ncbi:hypothetical protein GF312_19495 [Candidatus Poribacteria bacterium]|nr:hypothetical protein [Candidatus Poribacteria bacterium]
MTNEMKGLYMTPRKRVEAVLYGDRPDKVPFTIYECMISPSETERKLKEDGLCVVNRGYAVFHTKTPNVTYKSSSYEEDGITYSRRDIHTPVGDLHSISRPAGFTSWHIKRLFTKPEDYKPLMFMIQDAEYEPCYDSYLKAEAELGEGVILRGGIGLTPLHQIMISWMGVEIFAIEWLERRDEIQKLNDAIVEQHRKIYPLVANSPASHVNYGGNETGDVMGRERFQKYVIPCYNEAADILHKGNVLLGAHLDGNNKVWADLVAESGLDYVEAFTPAPDCDMTLREALDIWSDKVLWINYPSSIHIRSDEEVEAETVKLLKESTPGDRLIIGITEDIPANRWHGSMLAISRAINKHGYLPIKQ